MNETVVSAALRTRHYSRVKNVFLIPLAHKHLVKKMPLLGPRMHSGCFEAIFQLEDGVRNSKLALSAELVQEAPIGIAATNTVPSKDSFPSKCVPPNSSIVVAKYLDFIICKSVVQISAQI